MASLDAQSQLVNIPVSFGYETDYMIGPCLENDAGTLLRFSLADSPLASHVGGTGAAMPVFLELVMGRHVEHQIAKSGKNLRPTKTKTLCCNHLATPTSDTIWGEADIVCKSGAVYYVRAELSCNAGLVMTGTALWSIAP